MSTSSVASPPRQQQRRELERVAVELAAVDALEEQGQYAKAIASLERLLASFGKEDDDHDGGTIDATNTGATEAAAWWNVVHRLVRRYQKSSRHHDVILLVTSLRNDARIEADVRNALRLERAYAIAQVYSGKYAEAVESFPRLCDLASHYDSILESAAETGGEGGGGGELAETLIEQAWACRLAGDSGEAHRKFELAVESNSTHWMIRAEFAFQACVQLEGSSVATPRERALTATSGNCSHHDHGGDKSDHDDGNSDPLGLDCFVSDPSAKLSRQRRLERIRNNNLYELLQSSLAILLQLATGDDGQQESMIFTRASINGAIVRLLSLGGTRLFLEAILGEDVTRGRSEEDVYPLVQSSVYIYIADMCKEYGQLEVASSYLMAACGLVVADSSFSGQLTSPSPGESLSYMECRAVNYLKLAQVFEAMGYPLVTLQACKLALQKLGYNEIQTWSGPLVALLENFEEHSKGKHYHDLVEFLGERVHAFRSRRERKGENTSQLAAARVEDDSNSGTEGSHSLEHALGSFSHDEHLDMLAIGFKVVKTLYVSGFHELSDSASRIMEEAEKMYEKGYKEGDDSQGTLHHTVIRNDYAYYQTCFRLLETPVNWDSITPESEVLWCIGDSHVLPLAWRQVVFDKTAYTAVPLLVTGCKIWHLRRDSHFFTKALMAHLIHSLPPNSSVLLLLGEIDCRESILKTVEKAVYSSVDDAIQVLASIYENLIRTLLARATCRRIYVHPAPPVIDITRPIVRKLNRSIRDVISKIHHELHQEDASNSNDSSSALLCWLELEQDLIHKEESSDDDGNAHSPEPQSETNTQGRIASRYQLDGIHLSPAYIPLLDAAAASQGRPSRE